MKNIKLVLAVASMAMLLVAFAAPAMAKGNGHNNNGNDSQLDRQDIRLDNQLLNNGFDNFNRFDDNDFGFVRFNNFNNGFNHPFFDNNGVFQSSEQQVESGDSSQTFNVVGGGDNSNACQGIQGISNTGNAVNNTSVLQDNPFDNGFNDGFFHPFFNGFNQGEVEVSDSGNFTISPSQTTTCSQQVNQAASASG
jgi:hypothetical protein